MSTYTEDTQAQSQSQPPAGPTRRPPLRRAYHGRMIAGVAAGIADYLAIDVTIVRVAFAVFAFLGGAGIPAYLACLLLIPEEGADQSIAGSLFESVRLSPGGTTPRTPRRMSDGKAMISGTRFSRRFLTSRNGAHRHVVLVQPAVDAPHSLHRPAPPRL